MPRTKNCFYVRQQSQSQKRENHGASAWNITRKKAKILWQAYSKFISRSQPGLPSSFSSSSSSSPSSTKTSTMGEFSRRQRAPTECSSALGKSVGSDFVSAFLYSACQVTKPVSCAHTKAPENVDCAANDRHRSAKTGKRRRRRRQDKFYKGFSAIITIGRVFVDDVKIRNVFVLQSAGFILSFETQQQEPGINLDVLNILAPFNMECHI